MKVPANSQPGPTLTNRDWAKFKEQRDKRKGIWAPKEEKKKK